jgi:hypothetical protein
VIAPYLRTSLGVNEGGELFMVTLTLGPPFAFTITSGFTSSDVCTDSWKKEQFRTHGMHLSLHDILSVKSNDSGVSKKYN